MSHDELRSNLKKMISELIEVDDFGDDENFVQDLGVDSMMGIEIVARIEKTYRIQIPEEQLRKIKTLNDVVEVTVSALNAFKTTA
jgi:acyl carrier protein